MDVLPEQDGRVAQAMRCDQFRLRRQARRIEQLRRQGRSWEESSRRFDEQLQASIARRTARDRGRPHVEFNGDLPILARRREIAAALREHQVLVVAGETGSGKSTQLPKICLDAGFGAAGLIGHTQPRRIAARSVAARVADELGTSLGEAVGYKIRFQDKTSPGTYIKLMTDGILLAEAAGDRFLDQYEVIILDEAHERSLNVDFLLGILTELVRQRSDLRVIVTSATIDAARFARHFSTADCTTPVIEVAGRTYPVDVRYRPLEDEQGDALDVNEGIARAVHELAADGGDMLVFLPTERDIREAAERLRGDALLRRAGRPTEILPLYARLSTAEQNRIFQPGAARRIVLATNVAESSLTVPRIHSVIDTGTARLSRYSPRLRLQRLPIEAVSRASADQRKGRCGRLGPGVCIRLYDEEDFDARPPYTTPEIHRTNLAAVILQAKYLRLGEVDQIPFLDPPRPENVREGYKTLFEIGAVDDHRRLTELGRQLAALPVDPRIARMVVAGHEENCLADVLIIAAALEVQDPRLRPLDRQQAADQQHARYADEQSDFISFLKLWDYVADKRSGLSRGQFQRLCQREFLSPARLREWSEVHRQLRQLAGEHQLRPGRRCNEYAAIHRALLTGLLSCCAFLSGDREYTGAGGVKFQIWPGSGLRKRQPKWLMAAELVETGRRYGRTAARIDPAWLESLGAHLVKRTYSDPSWHAKSLSVVARERVTLFGLPIVAGRRVPFGRIDPAAARQLFIEHGLVGQEMEAADEFFRHNQRMLEEAGELAAQTRRREFILDEYRLHAFYNERVPGDVFDMAGLRRALKADRELGPRLRLALRDLLPEEEHAPSTTDFPRHLAVGSMQLPLTYHFEPGSEEDGVTLTVPAEALPQVSAPAAEWLVPGLVEEKLVALIRSLPKAVRRALVPAPDTARRVAGELPFGEGDFLTAVARRFSEIAGERISPEDFRLDKLPPHLRMRVAVVDHEGRVVAEGRDVRDLLQPLGGNRESSSDAEPAVPSEWHRDGFKTWEFGPLPDSVCVPRGGIEVTLFPAVVDRGEAVGLRLLETEAARQRAHRAGVTRLYQLANMRALRSQVRWLPRWSEIALWSSLLMPREQLEDQLQRLLAERAFLGAEGLPYDETEFSRRQHECGGRIAAATQEAAGLIAEIFAAFHRCQVALDGISGDRWRASREDMQGQLGALMHADFLTSTPPDWLSHYPRYLQAVVYRIEKLTSGGQARDEANMADVAVHWRRYEEAIGRPRTDVAADEALHACRWMIEEYRVSLFAQPLGTCIKVSPQRLEKQWRQAT